MDIKHPQNPPTLPLGVGLILNLLYSIYRIFAYYMSICEIIGKCFIT